MEMFTAITISGYRKTDGCFKRGEGKKREGRRKKDGRVPARNEEGAVCVKRKAEPGDKHRRGKRKKGPEN